VPHTGVARLALATGAPVLPVGISLDPARIVFKDTLIDGVTERVRWIFSGPYFVTAGRPMAETGSLDDRSGIRLAAARIMDRIALLAGQSSLRMRSGVEQVGAPIPLPSFGQD
jgi:1-acyl-sn-glycerol-3-phosphate acyltransferase